MSSATGCGSRQGRANTTDSPGKPSLGVRARQLRQTAMLLNLNFTIKAFFEPTGNTSDGVGYIYGEAAGGVGKVELYYDQGGGGLGTNFVYATG